MAHSKPSLRKMQWFEKLELFESSAKIYKIQSEQKPTSFADLACGCTASEKSNSLSCCA
jgi:hypothetical protein